MLLFENRQSLLAYSLNRYIIINRYFVNLCIKFGNYCIFNKTKTIVKTEKLNASLVAPLVHTTFS